MSVFGLRSPHPEAINCTLSHIWLGEEDTGAFWLFTKTTNIGSIANCPYTVNTLVHQSLHLHTRVESNSKVFVLQHAHRNVEERVLIVENFVQVESIYDRLAELCFEIDGVNALINIFLGESLSCCFAFD